MEAASLPPTPPASTSTKSSPNVPTSKWTEEQLTPPKSPESTQRLHSPHASGSSPLPPLPAEVFRIIVENIPPIQRPRLRLVCRAWVGFLDAEPHLWPYYRAQLADADQDGIFEHWARLTSVNGRRPGGGFRQLDFLLSGQASGKNRRVYDFVHQNVAVERFNRHLKVAEDACVTKLPLAEDGQTTGTRPLSSLKSLNLTSWPNTITTVHLLHEISLRCDSPLFEDLRRVRVIANLADLTLTHNFMSMFPRIEGMHIEGFANEKGTEPVHDGSWAWLPLRSVPAPQEHVVESLPNLRWLVWRKLNVTPALHIPILDVLANLELSNIEWEGRSFFRLLRYARRTLVSLELDDVTLLEAPAHLAWEDWAQHVDIRDPDLVDHPIPEDIVSESTTADDPVDQPLPIVMLVLRSLSVIGDATPPFWSSLDTMDSHEEENYYPTPILMMPSLERCVIDGVITDQDVTIDEREGPLAVLGRNAPGIIELDLVNSVASEWSVYHMLNSMSGYLRKLCFAQSEVTDAVVIRLAELTPNLERLDCRECHLVSLQTVARIVQRLREYDRPLMKSVEVDEPGQGATQADHRAHWWLDFIGVLKRSPDDPLGLGPDNDDERRLWKLKGKMSYEAQVRKQWEAQFERERAAAAQLRAFQLASGGFNLSGTGGAAGGSSSGGSGSASGNSWRDRWISQRSTTPPRAPPVTASAPAHSALASLFHQPQARAYMSTFPGFPTAPAQTTGRTILDRATEQTHERRAFDEDVEAELLALDEQEEEELDEIEDDDDVPQERGRWTREQTPGPGMDQED